MQVVFENCVYQNYIMPMAAITNGPKEYRHHFCQKYFPFAIQLYDALSSVGTAMYLHCKVVSYMPQNTHGSWKGSNVMRQPG